MDPTDLLRRSSSTTSLIDLDSPPPVGTSQDDDPVDLMDFSSQTLSPLSHESLRPLKASRNSPLTFFDLPSEIRKKIYQLYDAACNYSLAAMNRVQQNYHDAVMDEPADIRHFQPYDLLYADERIRNEILSCFSYVRFHMSISWFQKRPSLGSTLGKDIIDWMAGSPNHLAELRRLNIDSMGILPIKIDVLPDLFMYEEVVVGVTNDARKQRWKPGVKYLVHVMGSAEFTKRHKIFTATLAEELKASIDERKGSGVSLKEIELILIAVYDFAKQMEKVAHEMQLAMKKRKERKIRADHSARQTRFRPGPKTRMSLQKEKKPPGSRRAGFIDAYNELIETGEISREVYRDEDNLKMRQKLWAESNNKFEGLQFVTAESGNDELEMVDLISF
ncbi:inorganic diphosphatase-like protein [Elsinoe australis]|uniref:Inorganic diphosphatase-like protein n=1 Tax=Elsinoe australis TaxID=40998 RepID=A0A4U7BB59_9PEZI|nr:inorganic diphosphatase-like protein [Elsinoe australis]